MKNNPVQFAVVREDSKIESDIITKFQLTRAVLIGSGGCTIFNLKSLYPNLKITLIEPNPAQIELVKAKIKALEKGNIENFGISGADEKSFIECGNFESLFRQFRQFIYEFISPKNEIENAFVNYSKDFWLKVFAHKYWNVAFELFFSDAILTAMFTASAIQHAPPNSYPKYFRQVLEKGLMREDVPQNYFLHHIFLGYYLKVESALPEYLTKLPANLELEFFSGFAQDFHEFGGKQLVHFSNIFDWCDEVNVKKIAASAAENLEKGSVVVIRQLNNDKNYRPLFGGNFRWLETEKIVKTTAVCFTQK